MCLIPHTDEHNSDAMTLCCLDHSNGQLFWDEILRHGVLFALLMATASAACTKRPRETAACSALHDFCL